MNGNVSRTKRELLRSAGPAAIAILAVVAPVSAHAQATADVISSEGEALVQQNNSPTPVSDLVLQGNSAGTVTITVNDANPAAYGVLNSTLTVGTSGVEANESSVTAIVNEGVKSLDVSVNNALGTGLATVTAASPTAASDADATSDLALAVAQQSNAAAAGATQSVDMGIVTDGVSASTLKVDGNRMLATGVINSGSTLIELDANNNGTTAVGGSTGISIAQTSNDSSLDVVSESYASVRIDNNTASGTGDDLLNSTVSLQGNRQSAVAVGQSGQNAITASGNTLWTDGSLPATDSANAGTSAAATAGNAIASMQNLAGAATGGTDLTATVDKGAASVAGFAVSVAETVSASTINNDGNTASATIRGNEVSNSIGLSANAILAGVDGDDIVSPNSAASIASAQVVTSSNILAEAMGVQGTAVSNVIGVSLEDGSRLTASNNTVSADANGNRGANSISADGTTIDTADSEPSSATITVAGAAAADGGFAVASRQLLDSASTVSAVLVNSATTPTSSASIESSIGEDVVDSSVASNGNLLSASASGNLITSGTNAIDITGTNVSTTAALANYQELAGDVTALIGAAGTAGTTGGTYTDPVVGSLTSTIGTFDTGSGALTVNGGETFTLSLASLSGDALLAYSNALTAAGFTVTGTTATAGAGNYSLSAFATPVFTGGSTLTLSLAGITVLPTSATPADGGVIVTIGDDIDASSISVNGNRVAGSSTGNGATNRISADATNLTQGTLTTEATSSIEGLASDAVANAEYALANGQRISSTAVLTTTVLSQFAIRTEGDGIAAASLGADTTSSVTDSTLSVSSNVQTAATIGNSASNALELSGANLDTNGALTSYQFVEAATIGATSTMYVDAPAANDGSTLMLNANSNSASATSNTAANTVSIMADNSLRSTGSTGSAPTVVEGQDVTLSGTGITTYSAAGDFVLNNAQATDAAVTATASTYLGNNDGGDSWLDTTTFNTDGVLESTVEMNGNITTAAANANRSSNTLDLSANNTTAGAGVLNQQLNSGAVTANATSVLGTAVTGGTTTPTPLESAVDTSSVTIASNRTSATAGGNTSNNALNAAATTFDVAGTGGTAALGSLATVADEAEATFAVLNQQANTGGITANATVTYGATFAAGAIATPVVTNSSVSLAGNSASTVAYGNASSNALTLNALNTPGSGTLSTSAVIASEQSNYGAINANSTSTLAINSGATAPNTGSVSQSALSIGGSSLRAQAVGNSNTSVMTVNANNITFGAFATVTP